VISIGGLVLFFAKRIKGFFKKNKERLRWLQFERKWKKHTLLLAQNPALELADEVIGLWKGYLESITDLPFQEWTSSEISEALEDKEIFKALRSIDMIIYAGKEAKTEEATTYLFTVAQIKYQEKLTQIKDERTTR
jgi:hypothetical protein